MAMMSQLAIFRRELLVEKVQALEQALESCQCPSDLDGDGAVGYPDLVE